MTKPGWKTIGLELAPILAVALGWVSVAGNALKLGDPRFVTVGLATLPALALVVSAAVLVVKRLRGPAPQPAPAVAPPPST